MDISEHQRIKSKLIKRHPWESARLKFITHLLKKHKAKFDHILDLGSGDVYVLNNLVKANLGFHYTAIDTAFTKEVMSNLQVEPVIQMFQNVPEVIAPQSDCVLLLDVLEHCDNDKGVLDSLNHGKLIQNNALFLITVPAFQFLFGEHDILLGHYRRYNIRQLKQLISNAGLKEIECGYFFFTLLLLRFVQTKTSSLITNKQSKTIDNWERSFLVTKMLEWVLILDFKMGRLFHKIGIQIPGLSAYCLCKA
jgi:hypothetical protein